MSLAARGALAAAGIHKLEDLDESWTDERLLALRNFGKSSLDHLRRRQTEYALERADKMLDVAPSADTAPVAYNAPVGDDKQLPLPDMRVTVALEILKIMAQQQGYKLSKDFVDNAWARADEFQVHLEQRGARW